LDARFPDRIMRHRAITTADRRTTIGRCAAVGDSRRPGWPLAGLRGQLNGTLCRITLPRRRNHDAGDLSPLRRRPGGNESVAGKLRRDRRRQDGPYHGRRHRSGRNRIRAECTDGR
jgi:hypothetical protein